MPATAAAGTWGTAREVAGALNTGGSAGLLTVSCPSAGDCSAGGSYAHNSASNQQAFVINETKGTWGAAEEVPGTAKLNADGIAQVNWVSCASVGNCGAGGFYTSGSNKNQAFVVNEVNGTWRTAEEVPGTAALNVGGGAQITSVSCVSAGNCGAGGSYAGKSGSLQAFVITRVDGSWGTAQEVPGTAALNHGYAEVNSVSCASAANCGAAGYYSGGKGKEQAFVVNET